MFFFASHYDIICKRLAAYVIKYIILFSCTIMPQHVTGIFTFLLDDHISQWEKMGRCYHGQ